MDIDGTAKACVTFMNDIPVDRRYQSWPPSVQELLAPGWPNQLRYVRKNLYTAVIVMDPTTREGLTMVGSTICCDPDDGIYVCVCYNNIVLTCTLFR
jgi:hypothetical protein